MHENSMKLMRNFVNNNLDKSKKLSILDVGSMDVNGSYKELFNWSNWSYTGLDLEAGKNIDFVAKSLYDWGLDKKFDVVISGQTLEHVKDTHKWILEVKKHVKKNGLICIIAPWNWEEHKPPVDCWRIMPDGMRFLLEEIAGFELLRLGKFENDVIGIARKVDSSKTKMEQNLNMSLKELIKNNQNELFKSTYFGVPAIKSPADFWIYHEIIFEVKPDVIIEIGTKHGGGTLAYSHMLNNLGNNGRVIGLEIDSNIVYKTVRAQPNITIIDGDACSNFEKVKKLIKKDDKVLIIEDSSHTYENTLNVLNIFSGLVTKGSYFIVEDSNCWHGLDHGPSPGPYEAIETFMKDNNKFEIDSSKERFIITWNPKGYLKRIK